MAEIGQDAKAKKGTIYLLCVLIVAYTYIRYHWKQQPVANVNPGDVSKLTLEITMKTGVEVNELHTLLTSYIIPISV